jgi:hypothetical protein
VELSRFERTVIERLIDGDAEEAVLREQLARISAVERDYSGKGVFVTLSLSDTALPVRQFPNRHIEERPSFILKHPQLKHGATAILFMEDGVMKMLECATFGEDWPTDDASFEIQSAEWNLPKTH